MRVRQRRFHCLVVAIVIAVIVFLCLPSDIRDGSLVRYWGCLLGLEPPEEQLDDLDDRYPPYTRVRLDEVPSGTYECVQLPTEPSPVICIHDVLEDVFISGSIVDGVPWESAVVEVFQRLLRDQSDLGVIDVGANIGQYTLLSASMGRSVIAVEPWLTHINMLHTALAMNQLEDKVTLLHNAVSDKRREAVLHFKKNNMGAIRVVESNWPMAGAPDARSQCWTKPSGNRVETVYLDDIVELIGFPAAILKLDIEGHESRAMMQAKRLLEEVEVRYIFMEWEVLNSDYAGIQEGEVTSLLKLMTHQQYDPYTIEGELCNVSAWRQWPGEVIWVRHGANRRILKEKDSR